jgi:hypothetical protein
MESYGNAKLIRVNIFMFNNCEERNGEWDNFEFEYLNQFII